MEPFPASDAALKDPNGLIAVGGDLSAERLLMAYSRGIFPWFDEQQPILWWTPDPRMVLLPGQFHCSRSLRKSIRQRGFTLSVNQAFSAVMRACASPRGDGAGTWISPDMIAAYEELHQLGIAHSLEVRIDGELVGGLYGIAIGDAFFGESMFSRVPDSSKTAFAALASLLARGHLQLVDCQVRNPHLARLGAQEISRRVFENRLRNAIKTDMDWLTNALASGSRLDWPQRPRPAWHQRVPVEAKTLLEPGLL